jgi:uncharacterized protein with NAD-binding domain and iron-sulfur cluster
MADTALKTTKVAILGGGISALTAAFELTEHDPENSYDITVYTLGWRLGGKAAVGRDASRYDRAYEHGLHIWAGFYDNAFDVVKRLYARLGADRDFWKSCFTPLNHFTVMESLEDTWKPWLIEFPPNNLEPGLGPASPFTPWALLIQFLVTLENAFYRSELPVYLGPDSRARAAGRLAAIAPLGRPPDEGETVLTVTRQAAERLPPDPSEVSDEDRSALSRLIAESHDQVVEALATAPKTDSQRRLAILFDLAFAMARGLLSDNVFFGGFEAIDGVEWSDWMCANGAKRANLESAVVRGCYDYAFAARDPGIGAGTATLLALRFILTYKGSVLHALTAPMGDSIIAPLYQYLRYERNVKFEFFCRVKKLELSPEAPIVDRVIIAQQVLLKNGSYYDPLIQREDGAWSWPSAPDPNQIVNGDALKGIDLESAWTPWQDAIPERVLSRRTSEGDADRKDVFDIVILALGFVGLRSICFDFRERFPGWRDFLDKIATTQTAALQLWLKPSTDDLGWPDPETALAGFERPADEWPAAPLTSWEDNTRLLHLERERNSARPRSLAYFCGVFPDADYIPAPGTDPGFPDKELKRAKTAFVRWMNNRLGALWPNAVTGMPPQFRWNLLEAPRHLPGQRRLDNQYLRVNIDPSERYVLSVPGSVGYRLWPDRTGLRNLYLAGDWVRSGVNAGCIEAAVIAGRMTARAITEADMTITGDGNSGQYSLPIGALPLVNVIDKLKSIAAGGLGEIDAYCATIPALIKYVKSKLPDGLRLVPPAKWGDFHPIILVFSRQRHVRPGFLLLGGINYHEFLELIPNVERCDLYAPAGGPFTYMPYLLLDQPLAVAVGTNLYGFNKRVARISSKDGAYVVRGDLGEIQTDFHGRGLPGSIDRIPAIASCRRFLGQPFISQKPTGEWVYSYLDYRLDTATYQRIHGEIEIGPPFVEHKGVIRSEKLSAEYPAEKIVWYRFSSSWRLSMPLTSGQVSDTSAGGQIRSTVAQWTGSRLRQFLGG